MAATEVATGWLSHERSGKEMKIKDLNNLITLGEGFTVEFKKSGTSNIGRELKALKTY